MNLLCQVTLIEGARRLLPNEEEFACIQLTEALEAEITKADAAGIPVFLTSVAADGDFLGAVVVGAFPQGVADVAAAVAGALT